MGKKGDRGEKGGGEVSKKAQGQARKAEAAAQKVAQEKEKEQAAEAAEWSKGAKSSAKKEAEAAKKAEAARKKAEKDALLAEEEKNTPGRTAPKNAKGAPKKTKGLDLSQLDAGEDDDEAKKKTGIVATNIDDALDALGLDDGPTGTKIDRHPERRRKAAYAAFEERRLNEMESDGTGQGLRLNQKKERIRKEFEKSPENPLNQLSVNYDASKEEIAQVRDQAKEKTERRLAARE